MSGVMEGLVLGGLAVSAGSQILGGISSYGQSRDEAKTYKANAALAMQEAKNRAAQERDKFQRLAASQRASFGASGIDVNVGSPLDVLADTDAEGTVSAMQLLYSGELEAASWKQRAKAAKSQGTGSLIGGLLGGVGTGLMGGARLGLFSGTPSSTLANTMSGTYNYNIWSGPSNLSTAWQVLKG